MIGATADVVSHDTCTQIYSCTAESARHAMLFADTRLRMGTQRSSCDGTRASPQNHRRGLLRRVPSLRRRGRQIFQAADAQPAAGRSARRRRPRHRGRVADYEEQDERQEPRMCDARLCSFGGTRTRVGDPLLFSFFSAAFLGQLWVTVFFTPTVPPPPDTAPLTHRHLPPRANPAHLAANHATFFKHNGAGTSTGM